jgi:alpha-tubulin suppressor-like RCC1 family protein
MNLLLISRDVPDFQVFVDAVNENTRAVLYSSSTTQTELLESIQLTSAERLAVVSRKEDLFVDHKPVTESEELFKSLIQSLGVKTIDFLACNTLLDHHWTQFYTALGETGVTVGASNDLTGNMKYGGDWTMESTGQDIEGIYFTTAIEYYKYLLDFGDSTLYVNSSGLYGRGTNMFRGLGMNGTNGTQTGNVTNFTQIPLKINNIDISQKVVQVSTGYRNTIVVLDNGTIMGSGYNTYSNLGLPGGRVDIFTPIPLNINDIPITQKVVQVSMGLFHTLILLEDGTIMGVSNSDDGIYIGLPNNTLTFTPIPLNINGIPITKKVTQVSCGGEHSVILLEDGTIMGSGVYRFNPIGPDGYDVFTPLILKINDIPITKKVTQVSCGDYHTVILLEDGTIMGCGGTSWYTKRYQTGLFEPRDFTQVPLKINNIDITQKVVHISCGEYHTVILLEDGRIMGTGDNMFGQLGATPTIPHPSEYFVGGFTLIPLPKKAIHVLCYTKHTVVHMEDNTLMGSGHNGYNQLSSTSTNHVRSFVQIAENVWFTRSPLINPFIKLNCTITFDASSFVLTNMGLIISSELKSIVHTIEGKRIKSVTKTYTSLKVLDKVVVFLEKDSYL